MLFPRKARVLNDISSLERLTSLEEYLDEKCFFCEGKAAFQVTLKDGSHGFLCESD